MTREEALNNLYGLSEPGNRELVDTYAAQRLIDAIYDDFKIEVENLLRKLDDEYNKKNI